MNTVDSIISELSDESLRCGVRELHQLNQTGILPSGVVRELAKHIASRTGIPHHEARTIAPDAILRVAAFKWAGI